MPSLTANEVIKRFCQLATRVGNKKFDNTFAHDCFCEDRRRHVGSFIFDEEVLEFIEEAVVEKLGTELCTCGVCSKPECLDPNDELVS